jgi:hypothetical protein
LVLGRSGIGAVLAIGHSGLKLVAPPVPSAFRRGQFRTSSVPLTYGMDREAIYNMKPYIRRFVADIKSDKETLMHQAAARYWNEIAESQPLKTEWAQQLGPQTAALS